jgi:hypothetical protein
VDLLPLFDIGVKLRDSPQSQFVHEINFIGLHEELVFKVLDNQGKSSREEKNLPVLGTEANELLNDGLEFWREEFVGLVHGKGGTLREVGDISRS